MSESIVFFPSPDINTLTYFIYLLTYNSYFHRIHANTLPRLLVKRLRRRAAETRVETGWRVNRQTVDLTFDPRVQ